VSAERFRRWPEDADVALRGAIEKLVVVSKLLGAGVTHPEAFTFTATDFAGLQGIVGDVLTTLCGLQDYNPKTGELRGLRAAVAP
jgi:hypothetical protein